MKLHTLAAACAVLVSLSAGSAYAADPVKAKLAAPVAEKTKVIAGGAMFICDGDTCVAGSATSKTFATATCKDIAKVVGPIAAFGGERKQLEADKLAQCNAGAANPTQVANR